jgi:hypothetical protein
MTDSCYKHWKLPLEKLGTIEDVLVDLKPIKCSIYKGSDFISKILSKLDIKDTASSLTLHYDPILGNVKQLEVVCMSTINKKKIFSFKFNTSDVSLIYVEFDNETIQFFFSENSIANELMKFKLSSSDLKTLRSMLHINIHDDTQNNFISIKYDSLTKQIIFTDEITDFRLSDDSIISEILETSANRSFDIDKSVFKEIDDSSYLVKVREYEGTSFVTLFDIDNETTFVTTIPLLETISSTISYEDVLKDKGTFGDRA